jgi:hypothetical protein
VLGLDPPQQLLLAILALLLITASSTIAEHFTLPLLRLFEGYWPSRAQRLTDYFTASWRRRRKILETEWQPLAGRFDSGKLSHADLSRYIELDRRLREIPVDASYQMPTRLGNLLRASERLPLDKYGLDGIVCWPRLWLAMEDSAKNDVSAARSKLDASTRLTFWALLFVVWAVWTLIAIPIAAIGVLYGYHLMVEQARTYGQLIEAAYDVKRRALYKSVGWIYPADASVEKASGIALTQYLWRGSDSAVIKLRSDD